MYTAKKAPHPKITLVVVQKRNHLRAVDENSYDKNPPPGTYVDDLAVIDEGDDNFYMYSHLVCFSSSFNPFFFFFFSTFVFLLLLLFISPSGNLNIFSSLCDKRLLFTLHIGASRNCTSNSLPNSRERNRIRKTPISWIYVCSCPLASGLFHHLLLLFLLYLLLNPYTFLLIEFLFC